MLIYIIHSPYLKYVILLYVKKIIQTSPQKKLSNLKEPTPTLTPFHPPPRPILHRPPLLLINLLLAPPGPPENLPHDPILPRRVLHHVVVLPRARRLNFHPRVLVSQSPTDVRPEGIPQREVVPVHETSLGGDVDVAVDDSVVLLLEKLRRSKRTRGRSITRILRQRTEGPQLETPPPLHAPVADVIIPALLLTVHEHAPELLQYHVPSEVGWRDYDEDVDDGFGDEARHGGAADVLDRCVVDAVAAEVVG